MINTITNTIGISKKKFEKETSAFLLAIKGFDNVDKPNVLNTLVKELKYWGFWNTGKLIAIFPNYSDNLTAFKFNLLNPVDTDAAFRRTFINNPTCGINFIQFNGSTQYANTHIISSTHFINKQISVGIWNLNSSINGSWIFGAENADGRLSFTLNSSNTVLGRMYSNVVITAPSAIKTGWHMFTRRNLISDFIYELDGGIYDYSIASAAGGNIPTIPIYEGGENNAGTFASASNLKLAFSTYGNSLNEIDRYNLKNIITEYLYDMGVYTYPGNKILADGTWNSSNIWINQLNFR